MYDVCREFEGVEEEEILPASPEDPAAAARAAFFLASNAASFPELSSSAIYERASSFELKHGICQRPNETMSQGQPFLWFVREIGTVVYLCKTRELKSVQSFVIWYLYTCVYVRIIQYHATA
jgi:hypothetical protein